MDRSAPVRAPGSFLPPILARTPAESFGEFLDLCRTVPGIDVPRVREIALRSIAYYQGDASARTRARPGQELERRWYDSLRTGQPDYSVYAADIYPADLWACWVIYSRGYLRGLLSPKLTPGGSVRDLLSPARRVLDLGCGFGFTTAALAQMFPGAEVLGTNLEGTPQYDLAREVGHRHGFRLVPDATAAGGPADLVFASEYFEHFPAPVRHLRDILRAATPRLLVVANAFGTTSIGHFPVYSVGGSRLDGKATARAFAAELKGRGYRKLRTNLWNNRPALWLYSGPPGRLHR
jgi:SAM-dependent methyltransferase